MVISTLRKVVTGVYASNLKPEVAVKRALRRKITSNVEIKKRITYNWDSFKNMS